MYVTVVSLSRQGFCTYYIYREAIVKSEPSSPDAAELTKSPIAASAAVVLGDEPYVETLCCLQHIFLSLHNKAPVLSAVSSLLAWLQ